MNQVARFGVPHPKRRSFWWAVHALAITFFAITQSLGDILAHVERHGLADDTIVLFMSDNGGLSASGRGGKPHTHNKPLSSGKGSAYEGGVRVPMIAYWPGVTRAGSVCDQPVIIEDFFPSILEMAGIHDVQQIGGVGDGLSFVSLLQSKHDKATGEAVPYPGPKE